MGEDVSRHRVLPLQRPLVIVALGLCLPGMVPAQEGGRFDARFEPGTYSAGQAIRVVLDVTQYATGTRVDVEDAVPAGWTISDVSSSGNLGRPELGPQVLVLYKDGATGRFAATVLRDGDTLPAVLPASRVVAVVLDWINRDDNTGATVLTPETSGS